ncbi:MAG: hypothetical protein ACLFR6_06605 [Salinarchaeum sp.]
MTAPDTDLNDSSVSCFAEGTDGEMTECVVEGVFGAGPAPSLMGLLMGGVLLSSLYIAGDGSVVVPSVVTILLGSALVPILPPQYVTFAYTIVVLGITVAAFATWTRFTHQGGF